MRGMGCCGRLSVMSHGSSVVCRQLSVVPHLPSAIHLTAYTSQRHQPDGNLQLLAAADVAAEVEAVGLVPFGLGLEIVGLGDGGDGESAVGGEGTNGR